MRKSNGMLNTKPHTEVTNGLPTDRPRDIVFTPDSIYKRTNLTTVISVLINKKDLQFTYITHDTVTVSPQRKFCPLQRPNMVIYNIHISVIFMFQFGVKSLIFSMKYCIVGQLLPDHFKSQQDSCFRGYTVSS